MARRWTRLLCAIVLGILCDPERSVQAQTLLSGSSMALKSGGSATLSSPNYLGTYLTVPAGGATVNFTVNASEGGSSGAAPHMNLVIADSTFGLNIDSTSATNYATSNIALPAGTYFVRAERDYANSALSPRSFTLNNLGVNTVTGSAATFSNSSTDANALAASDTYIANYRQGPATVRLVGATPGTSVNVDLSRIAFNFGTAVPGVDSSGVSAYLGSTGTTQQSKYQQALNQNFNAIVPENMGKWGSNEAGSSQPMNPSIAGVDTILNYAQSHNMTARMHNLIWGNQQPVWVSNLISASDTANLSNAITNRINYYVGTNGNRSLKYSELDVYNESYHTGQNAAAPNYWSLYQPSGIAAIYNQVATAVTAAGAKTKLFVNEYNVLQNNGTNYATFYVNNMDAIRNAGGNVGGIGIQYYPTDNTVNPGLPNQVNPIGPGDGQHSPARIESSLQSLSVQGLPLSLNEFGMAKDTSGITSADTPKIVLTDTMRLMFGAPPATGFFMWGFQAENGGSNLFAPAAALYTVTTSNWNTLAITDTGKAYQDLLGIQDWDGNPNDGWSTHLNAANGNAPTVNADGTINFNGYYGTYNLKIGATTYPLNLAKGTSNYTILVSPIKGDFDLDGKLTNADIQAMLLALGNPTAYEAASGLNGNDLLTLGDFNNDHTLNASDLQQLLVNLTSGAVAGPGDPPAVVPEPPAAVLVLIFAGLAIVCRYARKPLLSRKAPR